MLKKLIFTLLFFNILGSGIAQNELYAFYNNEGKSSSFDALVQEALQYDVVLFGELHNNTVVHWLQLQLLKSLSEKHPKLVLSGEFFETDDQLNIDEWMSGRLTDKNFEAEAKLWNNYLTDYKPLLVYAKAKDIPFVASNVPRKYASLVSREGLDGLLTLSKEAKKFLPHLPIKLDASLPAYLAMKDMMHGSGMNVDFMIAAQALKDATMAESIRSKHAKGQLTLHINGSYHSNNKEGIVWHLQQEKPKLRILTINTVEQEDTSSVDEAHLHTADFIIVLPKDSPKSY
jgi:uncharacterized iron-regulated protein